jgi:hypothetical protein
MAARQTIHPKSSGFVGAIKDLEGRTFDVIGGSKRAIKYQKTLEMI